MDLFYRVLGSVARITESLSRKSINFVPLSFLAIGLLSAAAIATLTLTLDGLAHAGPAKKSTVAQISQGRFTKGSYVTLTGDLVPALGLELIQTKKKSKKTSVTGVFVPITQPDSPGKGLIVVMKTRDLKSVPAARVTVTGTLEVIPSKLATKLRQDNFRLGKLEVYPHHALREGSSPSDPVVTGTVALVTGFLGLMMLFVMLKRYVVFRSTGPEATSPAGARTESVLATGRFHLEGKKTRRHFVRIPAVVGDNEDGSWGISANVDASSRLFGFTTAERSGIWSITVAPQGIERLERGLLYYGTDRLASIRISYRSDAARGAAIVSFPSTSQREDLFRTLRARAPQAQSGS